MVIANMNDTMTTINVMAMMMMVVEVICCLGDELEELLSELASFCEVVTEFVVIGVITLLVTLPIPEVLDPVVIPPLVTDTLADLVVTDLVVTDPVDTAALVRARVVPPFPTTKNFNKQSLKTKEEKGKKHLRNI